MTAGDLAARLRGVLDASARRSAADRIAAVRQFATSLGGQGLADLARADPGLVGNCDGIPFATRIVANRHRMTADRDTLNRADRLDRAGTQRLAVLNDLLRPVATRRSRDRATGAIREMPVFRQVVAYAGGSPGRVVEVRGDLASASKVAVTVPGMRNKLNKVGLLTKEAERIRGQRGLGGRSAVVAWLGYDSPQAGGAVRLTAAHAGGAALRDFQLALAQETADGARTTLIAHSYGTMVSSTAIRQGARFDAVTVMGSPGMGEGVRGAADLAPWLGDWGDAPMFTMRAPGDFVSYSQWHGKDPATFTDAQRLSTGDVRYHTFYTRQDSLSLENIGLVVAERYQFLVTTDTTVAEETRGLGLAERALVIPLRGVYDLSTGFSQARQDRVLTDGATRTAPATGTGSTSTSVGGGGGDSPLARIKTSLNAIVTSIRTGELAADLDTIEDLISQAQEQLTETIGATDDTNSPLTTAVAHLNRARHNLNHAHTTAQHAAQQLDDYANHHL